MFLMERRLRLWKKIEPRLSSVDTDDGSMSKQEGEMLTVTEDAKQYLKQLLLDYTDDPDFGVRLVLRTDLPRRTGLVIDREGVSDYVVEHEGAKVLLVGDEVAELVAGATLDTEDTPDGIKLVISRE